MYKDAHTKIREDPSFIKKAPRDDVKKKRFVNYFGASGQKLFTPISFLFLSLGGIVQSYPSSSARTGLNRRRRLT